MPLSTFHNNHDNTNHDGNKKAMANTVVVVVEGGVKILHR